jgi:hypothetical protein
LLPRVQRIAKPKFPKGIKVLTPQSGKRFAVSTPQSGKPKPKASPMTPEQFQQQMLSALGTVQTELARLTVLNEELRDELRLRNKLLDETIRPLMEDAARNDNWWRDGGVPPGVYDDDDEA